MAKKYATSMAEVKVYINGKDQAKKDLEDLRKVAKTYADQMEEANNKVLESSNRLAEARQRAFNAGVEKGKNSDEYREASKDMVEAQQDNYDAQKKFNEAQKGWKQTQRLIKETEKMEVNLEEALQHLSEQDIVRLRMIERQVRAIRDKIKGEDDPDQEFLGQLNDALIEISDTIKQKKGELIEFGDIADDLTNIDDTSLAKVEQRLKSLLAATDKDDIERLEQLNNELNQVQGERRRRVEVQAVDVQQQVADGTWKGTIEQTQQAIELQKQYQKQLDTTDVEGLKKVEDTIKGLNESLSEGQRKMIEEQAKLTQDQIEKGTYKGTIEETEKAIAIQKQYQKTLDTTDAAGLKKVEDTIEALQQKLKQAQSELLSFDDSMKEAKKISEGTWDGTLEDLEKIKKSLEYFKKNKLKIGADDKDLKNINQALHDIDKTAKGTAMSTKQIQNVLDHLDSASVEDLEKAAKNLQDQLHGATRNVEEYAKTAAKLRNVNAELKKAKKEWEGQENVIVKTTKRLAAYVAVYGGFNAIVDKMKEVVGLNLQLSDSLADVQKTTGLTGVELRELGRDLGAIDTRTATTELYNLAAAAGQVGLKTQEDVLGFAKAANIISVALNELGAEGSATITKIATLTGDVARSGTEDALLKVGSAINELTANSAATAGPIADFISRVGGIASASGIAIHEMAALGAATDASAQSIEIAGTSMNKFITALLSNTENIAYAANLSVAELNGLIEQGDTMQAVIRVLKAMKNMSREGQSAVLKELGSEGARMNQYVAAMVANLDMLKQQLAISREAFFENTSVINEYNVKQESAIGILQRMKNAFLDTFVNSRMVEVLKDILQFIANIPRDLAKFPVLLATIKTAIMAIILLKLPLLLDKLMMQLSGLYTLLRGPFLAAMASFRNAWIASAVAVEAAGKSINGFTGFLRVLWGVIKANPIGIAVTALSAFVIAMQSANAEAKKLAKITGELSEKQGRQLDELQALRTAMDDSNASYADRAGAMKEINQMYSKYLGFELRELEVYEKKAAALELIVAKLKEQQALELKQGTQNFYNEEFSKNTGEELEVISDILAQIPEITSKRVPEAIRVMNEAIEGGAESTKEIFEALDKYFGSDLVDKFNTASELFKVRTGTETDKGLFDFLVDAYDKEQFEDYIDEYLKRRQGLAIAEENYNYQAEKATKEAFEKRVAFAKTQENRIIELQAKGNKATEAEQVEHLRTMLREQEEYLITLEALRKEYKEQDDSFVRGNIHEDGTVEKFNLEREYGILAYVESTKLDNIARFRNQTAIDAVKKQQELNAALEKLEEERLKENNDKAIAAEEETVNRLKKEHHDLNQQKTIYDRQWQEQYSRLLQYTVSDERQANDEKIKSAKEAIDDLNFNIDKDPYGKALNLKDWKEFDKIIENIGDASPKSLINAFKKLNEDYQKFANNLPALNQMFQFKVPMHSLDEARDQIFDWANQLRDELQRRGLTTTGATIFKGLVGEVDIQLDIIKVKFAKQQKEIKDAYLSGSISSEEMNRRIVENDREMMNERLELRKMLLGEDHAFHAELYPEMDKEYLTKLKRRLTTANTEVLTTLRQGLEDDSNAVAEEAIKMRERFEKELTAGDPFGTLRTKFRSSLDELLLMSSGFEKKIAKDLNKTFANLGPNKGDEYMGLDKASQEERLDFLIELSEKSYTVDRDGLRKMFESHGEYYNWVTHLDDQQMDVMLAKLQWFYDESLVKHKAGADRLIKAQESSYEQQGLKLDDVAKLQWERQNLINQRAVLQSQNTFVTNEPVDPAQRAKNESDILTHTQAINRLDEQILEAQKKAADKNKSFRAKQERETKEQMEASISALDAYYNEMEAKIRERGLELNLTDEEIERQILENNIKRQEDMIQLRKKLLGDESTFNPFANEGYKGAITGNVFFGENKNEEVLSRQAEQIKVWGKALTDGMRNQIAKSNIEIQKEAQKLKETIQNILLDKQFVKKAVDEMQSSFDQIDFIDDKTNEKLNFLWGNTDETKRTQEAADARMKILMQFSEDVYSEEAESFKNRLLQDKTFGATVAKMDEEEYAAFLILLQQYHDKVISAEKQHADERKRIIDQQWEEEGYQSGYDAADRTIEIAENNLNTMQNAGAIANEQAFFDQYQQLVLNRVALEQWAYEQKKELYKKNNATQEQFQQLDLDHAKKQQDFQQQLLNNYISRYQKMADVTTSYGNIIGDGFGRMIAGEEDAGKQLIKNLLTETIQMASQFAQRLILQSTFGAQLESIRATQNAAQLSAAYTTAMAEVGIEASKMAAIEAIAAGEITAQSMAQPDSIVTWGGAGAARAAVIIGLVAAATAAALALVNSLFPESKASETSNRKLSTGMLTYAEGNYPVLGNDGKVYDAKYEGAGMKTGIYGGGAHFGIFSEKQPEMIVDGKTTQKIILNYPYIYDAITTIAKNGRLVNAMPTFASGDYPAGMNRIAKVEAVDVSASGSNEQMERTNAVLEQATSVIRELNKVLTSGKINASVDPYANQKATKRAERFMKRRGID